MANEPTTSGSNAGGPAGGGGGGSGAGGNTGMVSSSGAVGTTGSANKASATTGTLGSVPNTTSTGTTTTTTAPSSTSTAAPTTTGSGAAGGSGPGTAAAPAVPVQAVAMKLMSIRLRPATAIIQSWHGEFTSAGQSEIVALKAGGTIEIYRIVMQQEIVAVSKKEDQNDQESSMDHQQQDEDDSATSVRIVLQLMARHETRSVLRSCAVVRFPGEKRDVLAVTADSGALSVLDFGAAAAAASTSAITGRTSTAANSSASTGPASCRIIHCVTFGKTACRRATPGQYVASDPQGRAILVAAVEKRKLCFVLNRDAAGKPTMASPLEAHRNRTITFAVTGLDNGYDNPIFACLEVQYPEMDDMQDHPGTTASSLDKVLAYYELDLGLNHVSRRWATTVHRTACCLAALPGGADGPGGILVGGEDWLEYVHEHRKITSGSSSSSSTRMQRMVCAIPRRALHPTNKGTLITTLAVHRQKRGKFFALAQTELGDVYKVTIRLNPDDKTAVQGIEIALLDTLPVSNSLNVSKLGMLFCAAEFGDHSLYQFERIDLPDAPSSTSDACQDAFAASNAAKNTSMGTAAAAAREAAFLTTASAVELVPTFTPTMLRNLRRIVTLDNPSPTTAVMVGELAGKEVSPQMYTLTGRGPVSALRILRHGAAVMELAVSELPGVPGGIFTIADNKQLVSTTTSAAIRNDQYIVVSFADATLVLSVGETVEEVGKESGFLTNAPTLACSALGRDGAVCQVHPSGVRHIQKGQAKQWHCPGLKRIECASANSSQVIIALAGGEVIYFELDAMSGNLTESATRDMGADVCCLDVGTIGAGSSRSLFAAIGCRDLSVRIVSLEPGQLLVQRSSTALKSRPHSVSLQVMSRSMDIGNGEGSSASDDLVLNIGLDDGSSLRATIDPVTGTIGTSPTRRFLGARPVSISRIRLDSQSAALLLSSRPWISRRDAASGKYVMSPLSYSPLDHGCSFRSDAVREGIVATAGKTLRILSVDTSGMAGADDESFNTKKVDLTYTPRQMTLISTTSTTGDNKRKVVLVVVESDYNDYNLEERKRLGFDPTGGEGDWKGKKGAVKKEDDAMDMDEDSDDEGGNAKKEEKSEDMNEEDLDEKMARTTSIRSPVPPGPGYWGSCIHLLDPANGCQPLDCFSMGKNEAALCCASVRFHSKGGEPLLAVGTVTGMTLSPMKVEQSAIALYRIFGNRLQLLHRTTVDDGPVLALAHFQGRLLAGIGKSLRLYEMGKRQLLRKCERRGLPTHVKTIQTVGDRAIIGDMMQSIQVIRYDATMNRLSLIATDPSPRPIVSQELLDWSTVAVGDKFGNISILRLPRGSDVVSSADLTGQGALWDSSDTTPKMELLANYYVGEVVCSMTRCSLVAGGAESLIYVTVAGRIGALVPFTSRDDVEFYSQLEACLRSSAPRLTGRDPQSYRSYYTPCMHVVDGDLCDAFNALSHDEQSKIAEKLDRTVGEIMKKLEDTRNSLL